MTTRLISLAIAAALSAALPTLAEEEGFSHLYRPADGRVGHVIVRERRDHMAPACLTEDDLDAFSYAVDTDDRARVLRMTNPAATSASPSTVPAAST
ncbi:hypothetical protein [Amaricoccus sp.]|uniref:hypothetical protein n=1 Tax=Amaricoccus sp. TaxID=1872485 RepID=UPI001B523104|nr:hypothetical protein [Amaricoccus sp.]MBP7242926.1 hypothetical protein [Amaricoccus sp.]